MSLISILGHGFGGKDHQLKIAPRHDEHPVHVFEVMAESEFGDLLLEPLTDFGEEHRIAASLPRHAPPLASALATSLRAYIFFILGQIQSGWTFFQRGASGGDRLLRCTRRGNLEG